MARAGRKRKSIAREANGRAQRAPKLSAEQEAMSVAVRYRQEVLGVSPKDAMDQKAATLLGRLCLQGVISSAQWQAGEDWHKLLSTMSGMVNAPRGFKTPTAGGGALSDDEATRRYQETKRRFDAANSAIEDHAPAEECRARFHAMRCIIVDEVDQAQMHGTLRTALNGLVKHFGLEGRKAA